MNDLPSTPRTWSLARTLALSGLVACAFVLGAPGSIAAPAGIPPASVVVIHNTAEPKSKELAAAYLEARKIPAENLIGLPLPTTDEISRADYNAKLRDPLQEIFTERGWWKREKGPSDLIQPVSNKIRFLVTVRGVPFKIARTPDTIPPEAAKRRHYIPSAEGNEASVDSELSLLGVGGYPIKGPLDNPLFKTHESIMIPASSAILIVGRIDGPSFRGCKQMLEDVQTVEEEGLWGMAYLDLAKKGAGYEAGDSWIETIARMNQQVGIPTVIDRHRDTFVTNYPMTEAAVYFGWYSLHRDGPFLNPDFRFRKGAVAVHLHSFSAFDLRDPEKRWTGPLLSRGAAATVGNVYEPFLQLTHHFDVFYARLLQGYTLGEAAYMSVPSVSWQGVVLGDPLYRPFASRNPLDPESQSDREFKALRAGFARWKDEPETLLTKLRTAANRMNSGRLFEALGLYVQQRGLNEQAAAFFSSARDKYLRDSDKLRQDLHLVDLDRLAGRKNEAILKLREAEPRFSEIPEGKAVTALLNILDPPAPPPVKVDSK